MDSELSQLKTLPLQDYAQTFGYVRDPHKSSRTVAVLRREADADKVLVWIGRDGHHVYRCERDHADRGSILDFAMTRLGCNLGQARQALRTWANLPSHPAQTAVPVSPPLVQDHEPDRAKVAAVWRAAHWLAEHPYLLSRSLPPTTLNDARFRNCWRQSRDGCVVFPNWDAAGLCGLEFRGDGVKRFLSGGRKGLWASRNVKTCSCLIVCEGPIDCLSHHALHGGDAAYVATGGTPGAMQRDLLAGLFAQAADRGASILIGTDNDQTGDQYVETLAGLAPIAVERITPVGNDWNADLAFIAKEGGPWN